MGSAGRSSLALFEAVGSSPGSENSQEGFLSWCQTGGVIWEGSKELGKQQSTQGAGWDSWQRGSPALTSGRLLLGSRLQHGARRLPLS